MVSFIDPSPASGGPNGGLSCPVDAFQKQAPTITLHWVGIGSGPMLDKVTAAVAGGTPPDMVYLDNQHQGFYRRLPLRGREHLRRRLRIRPRERRRSKVRARRFEIVVKTIRKRVWLRRRCRGA